MIEYNYNEFIKDSLNLTKKIDYKFDTIIAIARGGLTIAHFLGEYYDIRKVYSINTIGYNDTKKLDNIKVFQVPNLKESKNVLIVDDIVDSGDTLKIVLEILNKEYPKIEFKSASLFYKKSASIEPNFWEKEATEWIDFFWSRDLKP